MQNPSTHRSISLAAALALMAGAAAPAFCLAPEQAPPLAVRAGKSQSTLTLGGLTVRQTGAAIAEQRLFAFPGSSTLLMTWKEFTGARAESWFALSLDAGRSVAQVTSTGTTVRLRYAAFDPLVQREPNIPAELAAGPENELYLVQFVATPLEEMRAAVGNAGGQVLRFLTDNTHVVRMNAQARAAVAALPYVRWVGAFHPAYRLDEAVRESLVGGAALEPARYSIEAMRSGPGEQQAISDMLVKMGATVHVLTPDQYRMEATLDRAQLLAVLARNDVNFVDPMGPMGNDMNLIRQQGGAVPLLSGLNILGQGVRAEVFDGGALSNHEEWAGQAPLVHGAAAPADAHGTACYGVNFATGSPGTANSIQATGMLPQREQGIIEVYSQTNQGGLGSGTVSRLTLNGQAVDPTGPYRSCYQSSSVGSPQITTYSTVSAEVDDYLFRVDYLSCQSQSNTGNRTSRPQAWAKNIVSVGGMLLNESTSRADDTWATGASFGPAQDLRVKPDLSHSWTNVFTTGDGITSPSPTIYGNFSGTSSATPITAGHFGLLTQMWHQGVWAGFGGGATVFSDRPKSTTAKAMMINAAYRYAPPPASGNSNITERQHVGWGMADLTKLYNDRAKFFIVNATDPLTNTQTRSYPLTVLPGEPELRATMVFPDPLGNTAAAQQRINDLSLRVTSPDGTIYWGNNGMVPTAIPSAVNANYSTPGGVANTYDTVENVFVQNPLAGTWTVDVIASQVVADGYLTTPGMDAVYSLVVSNVTAAPPPPVCYANCDASTDVPFLNVADFTCFLTKFAANDAYANCDGSNVPPVLNVADFTCFLTKFAAGCSAP